MKSSLQNYTPNQIETIKSIIQKFDTDIDLDINNFINLVTIFDMLSQKEIDFMLDIEHPFINKSGIEITADDLTPIAKSLIMLNIANYISKGRTPYIAEPTMVFDQDGWNGYIGIKNWPKMRSDILDAIDTLPFQEGMVPFQMPQVQTESWGPHADMRINPQNFQQVMQAVREYVYQFQGMPQLEEYKDIDLDKDLFNLESDTYGYHQRVLATTRYAEYSMPGFESKTKSDTFHMFKSSIFGKFVFNESTNALYIKSDVKMYTKDYLLRAFVGESGNISQPTNKDFAWKVSEPESGLTMFEFYKFLWLKSIISEFWDSYLPEYSTTNKLAELLYLQAKDAINENLEKNKVSASEFDESKINDAMQEFLRTFNPSLGGESYKPIPQITYKEFYEFINAVRNQKPISSNIVNWLSKEQDFNLQSTEDEESNSQFITSLIGDMNLSQSLESVSDKDTINEIKSMISDEYSDFTIKNIYEINAPRTNDTYKSPFDLPIQHKTLVHGTPNASILTILRDGLLTRAEIHQDAKVSLTGLGLGDGIYFAQPYQAGKSLGYVYSENDLVYLFIVDVAYSKVHRLEQWGNSNPKAGDLVHAVGIGAHDRDELVAKYSSQVELKYLLAIQK